MEGLEGSWGVLVQLVLHWWDPGVPKMCHGLSYKTNISAISDIILTGSLASLRWLTGAGWCEPWPPYTL